MSAPFPVLFTAPLGSPDWLGDAVVRVGNSLVHPRRQWVWEKSTKPVRTLAVRTHVGTQHVAPRAPTPAHSEHSTQPAFSILEHADQSEVLALPTLPRQASTATMTHSDPLLGSILNMRSRNADHQIISDDDLQNFLPPASSTPRTRTAGSRRGLSLASLSLRKRESLDPDMSKHAITASSRSFSSKSFFSARTFGPSSSDPQRSATDIDLITCMARNLVETASPIDEDSYVADYSYTSNFSMEYDIVKSSRRRRSKKRWPETSYEREYDQTCDTYGTYEYEAYDQSYDRSDTYDRSDPKLDDKPKPISDRADRVLQDARQYLNIDPYATPHRKASFQSSNSAGSGEVPQWLAAAIRVTHTPRRSKSFHGDDEDKENVVYLNRASTSAFGPRTPSPTATLAQSAPTTPKRPEVSRPRALRASWNV